MNINRIKLPFTAKQLRDFIILNDIETNTEYNTNLEQWLTLKMQATVTLIGSGAHSQVFSVHNQPYVIKICTCMYNDAWLDYAKIVKRYKQAWVPKIGKIYTCQSLFVCVIEKLEPFNHESDCDDYNNISSADWHKKFNIVCEMAHSVFNNYDKWKNFKFHYITEMSNNIEMFHTIFKGLTNVRNTLDSNDVRFNEDLHSGNVMFRGNQIVIIDPIC